MGFPRQEHWSGLPFPSPGNLPNPGIKPASPSLVSRFFATDPDKMWLLCYPGLFAATICWPSLALLLSKTVWYLRKRYWVLGMSRDLPHLCISSVSFSKLTHSLCVLSQAGSVWFLMPRPALATCLQAYSLHNPAWASGMNEQIDLHWSRSVISAGQAACWVSASASVKWASQTLGSFRTLPILTAQNDAKERQQQLGKLGKRSLSFLPCLLPPALYPPTPAPPAHPTNSVPYAASFMLRTALPRWRFSRSPLLQPVCTCSRARCLGDRRQQPQL